MPETGGTFLVTGGSGFIGANLVRHLLASRGRMVVNLDRLTYAANPLSLADLDGHENYTFVHGDTADRALVDELLGDGCLLPAP
jgi:dTDP-glucose 4,6-dehydratase